jgi:dienelactone hydrolase
MRSLAMQKGYDKDAAKDAWSRIDGFFAERLNRG